MESFLKHFFGITIDDDLMYMLFKLHANRRLDFEFDMTPSVQLRVQSNKKAIENNLLILLHCFNF